MPDIDYGAILVALLILAVLVVAAAYAWYNFLGWTRFSYSSGAAPRWVPPAGKDVSALRFKGCVYTVQRLDGKKATLDVTPALNAMATAYAGGKDNPAALTLTGPLNAFSFTIPGFNERTVVPDPAAYPWCNGGTCSGAALSGSYRAI